MSVEMDPQLEAAKAYMVQTIRDATAWTAERLYQDPSHEIKKRKRQVGGHIPTTKERPARSRRSGQEGMRSLTPEDMSDFEKAAEARPAKTSKQQIESFFEEMWEGFTYGRMRRLRKDMNWLRKKADQHGIQPASIPWNDI